MNVRVRSMVVVVGCLAWWLAIGRSSSGQTQVLDLDALAGAFKVGLLSQDQSQLIYSLEGRPGQPDTLHAASLVNPGPSRQLSTQGIDVGQFLTQQFADRILVNDFTNDAVFAVDVVGDRAPIPLSPEPGTGGILSATNGQVALVIRGNAFSLDPTERDRLYTRSILGGPAVEVTGGVPQLREISAIQFSADGQTLAIGTARPRTSELPPSSEVYFATPGVTGLTPVLDSLPSNTYLAPRGSDTTGDHFVFFVDGLVNALWSVPTADSAATTQLNLRDDHTFISFDNEVLDPDDSRVFFSSSEPEDTIPGQGTVYTVWSAPLDGSTSAQVLAKLPARQRPMSIEPTDGPWTYVETSDGGLGSVERVYAVHSLTGEVVEFEAPSGQDLKLTSMSPDGSSLLFTDARAASNDLYLGRPGDHDSPQVTLLEVADTDRLVFNAFSSDAEFAVVGLASASLGSASVADRLLAVPLAGGPPITIEDVTPEGLDSSLINNIGYAPTVVAGNRLLYLKQYDTTQVGFFVANLAAAAVLPGDYNGNGLVEQADLDLVLINWGRDGATPPDTWINDLPMGTIDQAELDGVLVNWGRQTTSRPTESVPEPAAYMLFVVTVLSLLACHRRIS